MRVQHLVGATVALLSAAAGTQASAQTSCPAASVTELITQDACQKSIDIFQFMAPQLGVVMAGGNATMEASVLNNSVTGANLEGITVDTPGSQISPQPAQVDVTISGNSVGTSNSNESGGGNAIGPEEGPALGLILLELILTHTRFRRLP